MKKLPWILLISSVLLVNSSQAEYDDAFSMHALLQKNLSKFVYDEAMAVLGEEFDKKAKVTVANIDKRISIPECLEGFRFFVEPKAFEKSRFTARIMCESIQWFTYVNVNLSFMQQVVVTKTNLSPNTVLRREHLMVQDIDETKMRHTGFSRIEDVLGATLKYRLRNGQSISKKMLCFVCEGDRITIAARVGAMQVKTTGIAQQDGTLGDTIEVMNIRSKKIVFGEVQSAQEVIVSL